MVKIVPDPAAQLIRGDFSAHVVADELFLPAKLAAFLEAIDVRTADAFVAFVDTFPSALTNALDWNLDEVTHARGRVVQKLEGLVPSDILHPIPPPRRTYGVMPAKRR